MADAVSLCNIALGQIGSRTQIVSLNPPAPANNLAAITAAQIYQTQVDAIFRAANWNCARVEGPLTLLKAVPGTPQNPSGILPTPPVPFLYEYLEPPDAVKIRFVIPQCSPATAVTTPLMSGTGVTNPPRAITRMPFVPAIDKDSNGNQVKVILTNAPNALCVYTGRINNVDLWDPHLQNAVIGALAAWFCPPIMGDDKKTAMKVQMAVGFLNAARMSDGNEGVSNQDVIPDWMSVRDTGSSWGGLEGGPYMNGWINAGVGYDMWSGPDGAFY